MSEAYDVGMFGWKKSCSCPATTSVFFQSRRRVAVRRRTKPELTPLYDIRKAASDIEVDVTGGSCPHQFRAEDFEAEDRLPQRTTERA